jgi:hypothetical protein
MHDLEKKEFLTNIPRERPPWDHRAELGVAGADDPPLWWPAEQKTMNNQALQRDQGSQYHYDPQNRSTPISMKFINIGRNSVQIQISKFGENFQKPNDIFDKPNAFLNLVLT